MDPVNDAHFWQKAIHPEDQYVAAEIEKKLEHKEEYEFTYRIIRPDGGIRWLRDRAMPVLNDKGELERFDGTVTDFTTQKQLALNLKESREMYRTLIETVLF